MGLVSVSTVRKAARLAVYDEIMISAKKNHIPAANLKETLLRGILDMRDIKAYQHNGPSAI